MSDAIGRLTAALADRYQIERELGAGGMATVYLAHDVRHNRHVALKVLRPELAAILGGERFLKEIQLTANLQHPHILSLFDSGEADGMVFYVMPYVEGESLRDRLVREKQLPVEDAVRITKEVAGALDYAHRHGVVHRDIKPENILLHDGSALVADFGIALAASRSDGGTRMTETGMSLGTPHYMAPEQAMGEREITPKADVYALGCVLYEMLTGEPPFTGPTAQAIIARVMTEQPRSITIQRHTIPVHVEAVVRKALEKLPADRFATAAEFAEAFDKPGSVMLPATPGALPAAAAASPRQRLVRGAVMTGGALLAAVAGALLWRSFGPRAVLPVRPLVKFGIQLPREAEAGGATGSTIAFAPDGSRLVYIGPGKLFVRGLDVLDPVPIPGSDGGTLPFFSPDGQFVGFKQNGHLARVAMAGGPVLPICDVHGETFGATWTRSDTILFASDSGLLDVPAAGGTARLVARPDSGESFAWPDVLPDGRHVLFTSVRGTALKLAILDRKTGVVTRTTQEGGYPRYVTAGYVVLTYGSGVVSAVPFDARRLAVTGSAVPMADGLQSNFNGDANLGVARSGDFAYQTSPTAGSQVMIVDRHGNVRPAGTDTANYVWPRLSPDGKYVAIERYTSATQANGDIWIIDLQQRTRTRVTFDTVSTWPEWSPDGRLIYYARNGNSDFNDFGALWRVPADGSGQPESLLTQGYWAPYTFERSGDALLYFGADSLGGNLEIRRLRLSGTPASQVVLASGFSNLGPSFSPDGRWMTYQSNESGRYEVYVRAYPGLGGKWQVSLEGGSQPHWSADGREIFYRQGDQMLSAAVRTQPSFDVTGRSVLFSGVYDFGYDVTRDGQTFVFTQQVRGTDQSLFVTLNWFDQFRAKRR